MSAPEPVDLAAVDFPAVGVFDVVETDGCEVLTLENRVLLRPVPGAEPGAWSPFGSFGGVTTGGLAEAGFVDIGMLAEDGIVFTQRGDG